MELPTLTFTRDEARQEVERYRRARQHLVLTREDERMLATYRAIARGKEVIDLHRALTLGGTITKPVTIRRWRAGAGADVELEVTLPRVAVFRADKRWAWCDGVGDDGTVTFRDTLARRDFGALRFQAIGLFPQWSGRERLSGWGDPAFRALLPTVPPHLRPTRTLHGSQVPIDLSRFFVLWEAEWELDRTVPPGDPALLRHLGGTLYEVLAKWDLTPVEQAVLAGRTPTRREIEGVGV
jgi:hypothetical protein